MTNKELLDIQHVIESKIKKTYDRLTHVMILLIAIGMFLWGTMYYLSGTLSESEPQPWILEMLVLLCFLVSVAFGIARLLPHKLESQLDYLEKLYHQKPEVSAEQAIALLKDVLPEK